MFYSRYETISESDLVILLIADAAMASNHEKVFAKMKKVSLGWREKLPARLSSVSLVSPFVVCDP